MVYKGSDLSNGKVQQLQAVRHTTTIALGGRTYLLL